MNTGLIIYLLTALAGFVLLCAGTYVLAGLGWALIAGAVSMFSIAAFVQKGLRGG